MFSKKILTPLLYVLFLIFETSSNASAAQNIIDLHAARHIASEIASIRVGHNRTKLDYGVDTIFDDHSYGNNYAAYNAGRSYFRTGDKEKLRNIVQEILRNPTDFVVYQENTPHGKRTRLNLIKVFTAREVEQLLARHDYDHIGYDPAGASRLDNNDGLTNRAILCFDITNINIAENDFSRGGFITGFVSEGGRH